MAFNWAHLSYQLIAKGLLGFCCVGSMIPLSLKACTRVVYTGQENVVLTGRSMDWNEDIHSNLWVFPRGLKKDGAAGPQSVQWISKYGSLIVSGYEAGTADGMNEKGLVANLLYLSEADYGQPQKPRLSVVAWAQYALDNFDSVQAAVEALEKEPFSVVGSMLPNGAKTQLHLSLSDASGDSAIFEYIQERLVVHHGPEYKVETNSPSYDQQLALNAYWQDVGAATFLPGTSRSADRFARASFLVNAIPKELAKEYKSAVPDGLFINQAVASVLGVMRNVSVPLGISTSTQPNIASTLWRTVADHKNKVYFFDAATHPNVFWVNLADLNFDVGAPVLKLTITDGALYAGNVAKEFKRAEPFKFLAAEQ